MYVHHAYFWFLWRSEDGSGSPAACELPCELVIEPKSSARAERAVNSAASLHPLMSGS